jgi:GNAT superfamily N-acetyltransferase
MPTQIRDRHAADLHGCVDALTAVYQTSGYPTNWPEVPVRWLIPTGMLKAWVAVAGRTTVLGHVLVREGPVDRTTGRPDVRTAEVARLFVTPQARGQGVAARLLRQASDWAISHSHNLVLEVADHLQPAIALYEANGWHRIDTLVADWTTPAGAPVTIHRYTR